MGSARNEIIIGKARFSALSPTLVRLEYDGEGRFEDRRSIRALTRPHAVKFDEIKTDNGRHLLRIGAMTISYMDDGKPFSAGNLSMAFKHKGKDRKWDPAVIDEENLGGTFDRMDMVDRHLVAKGVNPAGTDDISNDCKLDIRDPKEEYFVHKGTRFGYQDENWMLDIEQNPRDIPKKIVEFVERRKKYPAGILSRNGYCLLNDSETIVFDDEKKWWAPRKKERGQDWYFFCYGDDYRRGLKDFILLCGKIPMLPKWSFGIWYSACDKLGEKEYKKLIGTFRREKMPLDVLVADLFWHKHGWAGFDWNSKLFPAPVKFIKWLHKSGIKLTFNIHPEGMPKEDSRFDGIVRKLGIDKLPEPKKWLWLKGGCDTYNIFDFTKKEAAEAVVNDLLLPIEKDGLDFWWIDGYVHSPGLPNQLLTNHVYYTHQQENSKNRTLILSRYGEIGGHRYPVSFTGDTFSQWEVLEHEIDYTARAGNVGAAYCSHDIGGYMNTEDFWFPKIDHELFVRWVQFGCLSPVMRIHSGGGTRNPWDYDKKVSEAVREAFSLRFSLIPYIYHYSRLAHTDGMPLCRKLYMHYPEDENSYGCDIQYLFGKNILVAPVASAGGEKKVYLPEGKWYAWEGKETLEGPAKIGRKYNYREIPLFVKAGSIIPRQEFSNSISKADPGSLILDIYPDRQAMFKLYEDDGESLEHAEGKYSFTEFRYAEQDGRASLNIGKPEGEYKGMPLSRRYKVNVFCSGLPVKVSLDGKLVRQGLKDKVKTAGWSYDDLTKKITLNTGVLAVSSAHAIEIER